MPMVYPVPKSHGGSYLHQRREGRIHKDADISSICRSRALPSAAPMMMTVVADSGGGGSKKMERERERRRAPAGPPRPNVRRIVSIHRRLERQGKKARLWPHNMQEPPEEDPDTVADLHIGRTTIGRARVGVRVAYGLTHIPNTLSAHKLRASRDVSHDALTRRRAFIVRGSPRGALHN
ncbi:hypothetical protein X777_14006 [Ooceraea biroi]|uniref:Uncharacterized protein n=1 Tax=Ooceraea biroi TaxID=2015173 RepID=A0A026WXI0_OOCBI|nr:hypothetical protein X777_14006 [Ooceraea biroi]